MEQATSGEYFLPTAPPPGPPSLPTTAQRPLTFRTAAARRPSLTPQPRIVALSSTGGPQPPAPTQEAAEQCSTIPQLLEMRILLTWPAWVSKHPQQSSWTTRPRLTASLPTMVAAPAFRLGKVAKRSSSIAQPQLMGPS